MEAQQDGTSRIESRLAQLGLALPDVAAPVASYVPAVRSGEHVWTSGQLPMRQGALRHTGKVAEDGAEGTVDPETARGEARQCALNALAAIKALVGDLDRVRRIVKVTGFVASVPEFTGQAGVLNGASDLLGEVFEEAGVHSRSAVGVAALPLDAPVEVELIVELR